MAVLNFQQVLDDSLALAKKELGSTYKKLKPYAEHEFKQFAENLAFLAGLKLKGTISQEELKLRLQLQKQALANVLLAIKGIGIVAAEKIINGVLGIIAKAIKGSLKVSLPV
jgi:hypothetical protein